MPSEFSAPDIVEVIQAAGGSLRVDDGGQLRVQAPAHLLDTLRPSIKALKPELVALVGTVAQQRPTPLPIPAVWDAADWHHHFSERAAIREYDGDHSRSEAERLAYGECQMLWHHRHGLRPDRARCADCDELMSGAEVFDFGENGRVHFTGSCLEAFGRRWRGAAEVALRALGVAPPSGWER